MSRGFWLGLDGIGRADGTGAVILLTPNEVAVCELVASFSVGAVREAAEACEFDSDAVGTLLIALGEFGWLIRREGEPIDLKVLIQQTADRLDEEGVGIPELLTEVRRITRPVIQDRYSTYLK